MIFRYTFIGFICFVLLGVLILFLVQPGKHRKTKELSNNSRQLMFYLSDWGVPEKTAFADCMLVKSNDDRLTYQEAQECADSIQLNK